MSDSSIHPTSPPGRAIWPLTTGVAGTLWLVQTAGPVFNDLSVGQSNIWSFIGLAIAAVSLAVGLWKRWSWLLLFALPVALIPAVALLNSSTMMTAMGVARWGLWLGTFLLYSIAASAFCAQPDVSESRPEPIDDDVASVSNPHPTAPLRAALAVALLLLPALSIGVWRTALGVVDPDQVLLAHLLVLFVWTTAFYLFFVVPLLNLDADAIRWRRELKRQPERWTLRRLGLRVLPSFVIFASAVALLVAL